MREFVMNNKKIIAIVAGVIGVTGLGIGVTVVHRKKSKTETETPVDETEFEPDSETTEE